MFGSCARQGTRLNSRGGVPALFLEPPQSAAAAGDRADQHRSRRNLGARQGDHLAQAAAGADPDAVADHRRPVDADVVADLATGAEQHRPLQGALVLGRGAAAVSLHDLALALDRDRAAERVEIALAQLLEVADVVPVGVDLVRVEGHVALEQAREDVHRPVGEARRVAGARRHARPRGWEEVEDLGTKHVDAAVGQVGEGLGRVGLLLEALDAAVDAGDRHPELAGVRAPLGRQRRDPVVGLVEIPHPGQIDVGERVAGDDQERVAEEAGGFAHPTRVAQQSLLGTVGQLDPEIRAVAEVRFDQLREPVQVGDRLGEGVAGEEAGDVLHHRPVQHRHHRLRHLVGDRAQPGAKPGREDHRLHITPPPLLSRMPKESDMDVHSLPRPGAAQVPWSHDVRYFDWTADRSSISMPLDTSFSLAISWSISRGTGWTLVSRLAWFLATYSAASAWLPKLMSITPAGWPSAPARLTSRPSARRKISRPSSSLWPSTSGRAS